MATTGIYGRLPRAAPDLTASIVALVREAQAQTDQNMVDAWKNGGKVAGKGVDDDRLLKHLKDRRDMLSEDDPQWDEWNSNYMQYDFAINESKMALKNDQGKISDAQMAAFYKKWAGREDVQKDSEFYRSLLSRAAKWGAAAKARSAGNSARAAAESHQKWVNGYYKDNVKGSETATGYLLEIAKTYQAAPPGANSLNQINPNSDGYAKFLDVVSDGKSENPNVQNLINEMVGEIKKTQPNFSWSESNLNDLLERGSRGLKRLQNEATSETERKEWAKRREELRYEKTRIRQTRANERVQVAADTYANDIENCGGNPYCGREVTQKFRDKLQAEVPNVVAGNVGGKDTATTKDDYKLTKDTQDPYLSSALLGTISQLDDALAGKPVKLTAASIGDPGSGAPTSYTIFDAAAGNSGAKGGLADGLNRLNLDKDKLDRGGWIGTTPKVDGSGAQLYDGQGIPMYDYTVYDVTVPAPEGYVAIPGATMVTDRTRTAMGPEGPTPVTVTPTTYVAMSPPSVQYQSPTGETLTPSQSDAVKMFNGKAEADAPWVELKGVKGPDGKARTLYRTGNGADVPYLYHEQPPVGAGTELKKTPAGQFIVPTTFEVDADKKPYMKADVSSLIAGVEQSRTREPSGNYVYGTYTSPGATTTAQAISDLYSKPPSKETATLADKYLRDFQRGIEGLALTDPNRAAGERDYDQLSQSVSLHQKGNVGRATVASAYGNANSLTPAEQERSDLLTKAGFKQYGQDEFDRRMSLLGGIDDADARLSKRIAQMTPQPGMGGKGGYYGPGWGGALANIKKEQEALANQKKDVFNPTISVSNIKVPGMPTQVQAAPAPPFAGVGGYMGGWAPTPLPAPVTAAPAPKPVPSPSQPPNHTVTPPPKTQTPGPSSPNPNANRNPGEIIAGNTQKAKVPAKTEPPRSPYYRQPL